MVLAPIFFRSAVGDAARQLRRRRKISGVEIGFGAHLSQKRREEDLRGVRRRKGGIAFFVFGDGSGSRRAREFSIAGLGRINWYGENQDVLIQQVCSCNCVRNETSKL